MKPLNKQKLPLPNFEVGDLVQTAGFNWLPPYENQLCIITAVDWRYELIGVYSPWLFFGSITCYKFNEFSLIQKNFNKLIALAFS